MVRQCKSRQHRGTKVVLLPNFPDVFNGGESHVTKVPSPEEASDVIGPREDEERPSSRPEVLVEPQPVKVHIFKLYYRSEYEE